MPDHPGSAVRGTHTLHRPLTGRNRPRISVSAVGQGSVSPRTLAVCLWLPPAQVHSPPQARPKSPPAWSPSCSMEAVAQPLSSEARRGHQSPLSHLASLRAGTPLVPWHLNVSGAGQTCSLVTPSEWALQPPVTPALCSGVGTVGRGAKDSKEVRGFVQKLHPLQISHICLAAPASVTASSSGQ